MNLLLDGAKELGFPLSQDEARLFGVYLSELLKWNEKVNLTAITDRREIIIKHFLDSLALLRILPDVNRNGLGKTTKQRIQKETGGGREEAVGLRPGGEASRGSASMARSGASVRAGAVSGPIPPARGPRPDLAAQFTACDIGSGAGFPGLAVKIVLPAMVITLVEPIHKKAVFLRQVSRAMGLMGVTVLEARAEDLPEKIVAPFDIVFSRAFKAPSELLPLAAPILNDGGHAALSLGSGTEYEPQPGWRVEREEEIVLPHSDIQRRLILLKKS